LKSGLVLSIFPVLTELLGRMCRRKMSGGLPRLVIAPTCSSSHAETTHTKCLSQPEEES
jgi:hypothetical protein